MVDRRSYFCRRRFRYGRDSPAIHCPEAGLHHRNIWLRGQYRNILIVISQLISTIFGFGCLITAEIFPALRSEDLEVIRHGHIHTLCVNEIYGFDQFGGPLFRLPYHRCLTESGQKVQMYNRQSGIQEHLHFSSSLTAVKY